MFTQISLLILIFGRVIITMQNEEAELLIRTVGALNKSLDFILSDYLNMNADGILGISESSAHLRKAISKTIDPATVQVLKMLFDKAEMIYELQTPNLPSFPYKYYVFNNYILPSQLWEREINFSYGQLNQNPNVDTGPYDVDNIVDYVNYVVRSTFSEEQSDRCLVEVAAASEDTEPHDCPISEECVEYMLTIPTNYLSRFPGYGVTHMALFLQIARNRNCKFNYAKVNEMLKQECSYVLWELHKNVEYGYIPNLDDIFFEQIDICGLEGFGEFLEKDYLEHVLKAQNSHGGFGIKRLTRKQLLNHNRSKREAVDMKYGANSHTTGLGVAVLALYVRVLIEKPFSGKAFYEVQ